MLQSDTVLILRERVCVGIWRSSATYGREPSRYANFSPATPQIRLSCSSNMKDVITVGIVLHENEISVAAIGFDEFEIKRLEGPETAILESRAELQAVVHPLLDLVEEEADILIREVVCHDVD